MCLFYYQQRERFCDFFQREQRAEPGSAKPLVSPGTKADMQTC